MNRGARSRPSHQCPACLARHMTTALFRTLLPQQNGEQFPRITAVVAGEALDLVARGPHTIIVARAVLFRGYRGSETQYYVGCLRTGHGESCLRGTRSWDRK